MVWRLGLDGGGQCFLSGGRARHRVIFWRKEIVILKKYLGNYCLQLLSAAAAMCANPSLSSTNYSCLRSIVYCCCLEANQNSSFVIYPDYCNKVKTGFYALKACCHLFFYPSLPRAPTIPTPFGTNALSLKDPFLYNQ